MRAFLCYGRHSAFSFSREARLLQFAQGPEQRPEQVVPPQEQLAQQRRMPELADQAANAIERDPRNVDRHVRQMVRGVDARMYAQYNRMQQMNRGMQQMGMGQINAMPMQLNGQPCMMPMGDRMLRYGMPQGFVTYEQALRSVNQPRTINLDAMITSGQVSPDLNPQQWAQIHNTVRQQYDRMPPNSRAGMGMYRRLVNLETIHPVGYVRNMYGGLDANRNPIWYKERCVRAGYGSQAQWVRLQPGEDVAQLQDYTQRMSAYGVQTMGDRNLQQALMQEMRAGNIAPTNNPAVLQGPDQRLAQAQATVDHYQNMPSDYKMLYARTNAADYARSLRELEDLKRMNAEAKFAQFGPDAGTMETGGRIALNKRFEELVPPSDYRMLNGKQRSFRAHNNFGDDFYRAVGHMTNDYDREWHRVKVLWNGYDHPALYNKRETLLPLVRNLIEARKRMDRSEQTLDFPGDRIRSATVRLIQDIERENTRQRKPELDALLDQSRKLLVAIDQRVPAWNMPAAGGREARDVQQFDAEQGRLRFEFGRLSGQHAQRTAEFVRDLEQGIQETDPRVRGSMVDWKATNRLVDTSFASLRRNMRRPNASPSAQDIRQARQIMQHLSNEIGALNALKHLQVAPATLQLLQQRRGQIPSMWNEADRIARGSFDRQAPVPMPPLE